MATRSVVGFAIVLVLLAGRAAAGDVLVVAPIAGPGIDFIAVQEAVAAAHDGDVLVILPGDYDGQVLLENRQLVLAGVTGPGGERPRLAGLLLSNLAADRATIVRGLDIQPTFFGPNSLTVQQCAGPVLLEDCRVLDFGVQYDSPQVVDCDHVVFTRCTLQGPRGLPFSASAATPGGSGLQVTDSSVTLYDVSATGGRGSDAELLFSFHPPASVGGAGVTVSGGTLFVAGCNLSGGAGGDGTDPLGPGDCFPPANGGDGLVLDGLLRRLDTTLAAGAPGVEPPACPPAAAPGSDLVVLGGSIVDIPQTLRRFALNSPVAPGDIVSLDVTGAPLEPVVLLQALAPLGQWLGGLKGTLAGAPPYTTFTLGFLDSAGTLHLEFPLPAGVLPPGLSSLLIVDQLVTPAAGGGGLLSSPSALVLVDEIP